MSKTFDNTFGYLFFYEIPFPKDCELIVEYTKEIFDIDLTLYEAYLIWDYMSSQESVTWLEVARYSVEDNFKKYGEGL